MFDSHGDGENLPPLGLQGDGRGAHVGGELLEPEGIYRRSSLPNKRTEQAEQTNGRSERTASSADNLAIPLSLSAIFLSQQWVG